MPRLINDPAQVPLDTGSEGSSHGLGLDYVSVSIVDYAGRLAPAPPKRHKRHRHRRHRGMCMRTVTLRDTVHADVERGAPGSVGSKL